MIKSACVAVGTNRQKNKRMWIVDMKMVGLVKVTNFSVGLLAVFGLATFSQSHHCFAQETQSSAETTSTKPKSNSPVAVSRSTIGAPKNGSSPQGLTLGQRMAGQTRRILWQTNPRYAGKTNYLPAGKTVNPDVQPTAVSRQEMTGLIPKFQSSGGFINNGNLGNGWSRGASPGQLKSLPGAINWHSTSRGRLLGGSTPSQNVAPLRGTAVRNVPAAAPRQQQTGKLTKVWLKDAKDQWAPSAYFRKAVNIDNAVAGWLTVDANCEYQVYCNGYLAANQSATTDGKPVVNKVDVSRFLRGGKNMIAVFARRTVAEHPGIGIQFQYQTSTTRQTVETNKTWLASEGALPLWKTNFYNDRNWKDSQVIAKPKRAASTPIASVPVESMSPKISVSAAPPEITIAKSSSEQKPKSETKIAAKTKSQEKVQAGKVEIEKADVVLAAGSESMKGKKSVGDQGSNVKSANLEVAAESSKAGKVKIQPAGFSKKADSSLSLQERSSDQKEINLRVLPQFIVEPVAGAKSGSLIAMAFDELGRIVASREKGGLIRIDLTKPVGSDQRVITIHPSIMAVQGILPLNGQLYVTGISKKGMGLYVLTDTDNDNIFETEKKLCGISGKPGEHGPHAIHLGSDRMLYVLLGNHCQLEDQQSLAGGYRFYEGNVLPKQEDPGGHAVGVKAPGGTLVRLSLDGKYKEVFAGGIRNGYDFGINAAGEIFVHDSDMESDVGTSWYRPTALYHLTAGCDLGWRSGSAKWPTYYPDTVRPMLQTGRGSPSGAVIYDHVRYPKEFRGAMFLGDWSAGRILCAKLIPEGAGYRSEVSTFMEGTPLNVTDLAIGPKDGALYVSLGGRDSSGGIYRVRWAGKEDKRLTTYQSLWEEVIRTPMFFSAPTRQRLAELRVKAGDQWDSAIKSIATSQKNVDSYRIRAINVMQWFGPVPSSDMLSKFASDKSAAVRRTAASIIGSRNDKGLTETLQKLLSDSDPAVQRIAAESMTRRGDIANVDSVFPLLSHEDIRVRLAGRRLLETLPVDQWADQVTQTKSHESFVQGSIALLSVEPNLKNAYNVLVGVSNRLPVDKSKVDVAELRDLIRVAQLAVIHGNVDGDKIPAFNTKLVAFFPSDHHDVQKELTNLLIRLKVPKLNEKFISFMEDGSRLETEKFHLAFHLSNMNERLNDACRFKCLEVLESVSVKEQGGGSFPFYAGTAASKIASFVSPEKNSEILAKADQWPNAAVVILTRMGEDLSKDQIAELIRVDKAMGYRSDSATRKLRLAIVARLATNLYKSKAAGDWLVDVWKQDPGRREIVALAVSDSINKKVSSSKSISIQPAVKKSGTTVATIKASSPTPLGKSESGLTIERKAELKKQFWESLAKSLPVLTQNSAKDVLVALNSCEQKSLDPEDYRQLILVGMKYKSVSGLACGLLGKWAGANGPAGGKSQNILQWQKWYSGRYANHLPATLPSAEDSGKWTVESLMERVQKLERDSSRGLVVFKKALCADCHQAAGIGVTVGPDLTSLAKRFTEKESLESILHPSQVIPQRYRSKVVMTEDGKVYTGLVSESGSSSVTVIDQAGQRTTLQKIDILEIKPSNVSVMPSRLLEDFNAQQVADLMEFLKNPEAAKK